MVDKKELARIAASAATGGAGRAASKAIQRTAEVKLRQAAEYTAGKYLEKKYGGIERKLTGVGFWMMFLMALFKEAIDFFLTFTLVLVILVTAISMALAFFIWFYLATHGVKMGAKKTAVMVVSTLIELIPFLSVMPTFPLTLLIIRYMDGKEFKEAQKEAEKLVVKMFKKRPKKQPALAV